MTWFSLSQPSIELFVNVGVHACSLATPGLRFTGNICVRFAYFMYGSGVETLLVYTRFYGESNPVFVKSSEQGNFWLQASIDISIIYADRVQSFVFYNPAGFGF